MKKANEEIKNVPETAKYAYADINCRLKVKDHDGKDSFFCDISEFNAILKI